jgi:putative acetyltransferase
VKRGWRDEKGVYSPDPSRPAAGEKLLAALEKEAINRECHTVRLETGIHQHAAVALYTRNGYQTRSAFAPYQPDPLSIFMEKLLLVDLRSAAL